MCREHDIISRSTVAEGNRGGFPENYMWLDVHEAIPDSKFQFGLEIFPKNPVQHLGVVSPMWLGAGISHASVFDAGFHRHRLKLTPTNGVPLESYVSGLSEKWKKSRKKFECSPKNSNVWWKITKFSYFSPQGAIFNSALLREGGKLGEIWSDTYWREWKGLSEYLIGFVVPWLEGVQNGVNVNLTGSNF